MKKPVNLKYSSALFILILIVTIPSFAIEPYRYGTTTANFLEIGLGASGNAMGDAQVAYTHDLMSIYWNPAGMAFMQKSEAKFINQPYVADIGMQFAGVGLVMPGIGTIAIGLSHMAYGDEMDVTTLERPDGTGEKYSASDNAFALSFSRRLVQWFAFGASAKYINSNIWHSSGNAMALDLGAIVHSNFFAGKYREDGMKIGMSISNYGTRLKFDGMDLLEPIDISKDEGGNYSDVSGKYNLTAWELPLIFRIGISAHKHITQYQRITLAVDALHPNNNHEYLNIGAEYKMTIPVAGDFFLRAGFKGLSEKERMDYAVYGPTFGFGLINTMAPHLAIKLDFAYRSYGILGNTFSYDFGVMF
ncbi:MAG: PorV/PorQ family protein [Candidatus Marinimicrobia bacterium]|nr:PorV/PorQ family protein [Candidatus Neomarinimicrobiota bacterium]